MLYELSFEPPETWVWLFQEMLAFTFLPEIISHSTFIASATTDLCIGRRGTLIKTYSCHWNQNLNCSFPIPLPDSKNDMTLIPLRFDFSVGELGLQTWDCISILGWAYVALEVLPSSLTHYGHSSPSRSLSPVQDGGGPQLISTASERKSLCSASFPWRVAPLSFNNFYVCVVLLFSLPYL